MAHLHRFFVANPESIGDRYTMTDAEAHHALRVVRLRAGDTVALFDGDGHEWLGVAAALEKRELAIEITSSRYLDRPARATTLVQGGLQNAKRMESIVHRCTKLGVSRIVFFRAERSEAAVRANDKWRRHAIESCKQCGRLWLPEIDTSLSLEQSLDEAPETLLVATTRVPACPVRELVQNAKQAVIVVGPEGDLSDAELTLVLERKHGVAMSLGEFTLRSDVAAVTACALVQYEMGLLGPLPASHDAI